MGYLTRWQAPGNDRCSHAPAQSGVGRRRPPDAVSDRKNRFVSHTPECERGRNSEVRGLVARVNARKVFRCVIRIFLYAILANGQMMRVQPSAQHELAGDSIYV